MNRYDLTQAIRINPMLKHIDHFLSTAHPVTLRWCFIGVVAALWFVLISIVLWRLT